MHIGLHNQRFNYTMKLSNEENVNIMKCEEEKDLGVFFDCMLSFDSHIQTVINIEANRNIGIIRRTFNYFTRNVLIKLYKALVRPQNMVMLSGILTLRRNLPRWKKYNEGLLDYCLKYSKQWGKIAVFKTSVFEIYAYQRRYDTGF